MNAYVLPELPYGYSALEPFISKELLELHHAKHHAAYVSGANAALDGLSRAYAAGDTTKVDRLARNLAFNLAGHINHSIFWENLTPNGTGAPTGMLADALEGTFGSFDGFREQFATIASAIQGSGWAMLVHDSASNNLVILQVHDHQHGLPVGCAPLLVLDMWEHAFYLDYQNDKANYLKAFWQVVNWDNVASRLRG